VPRGFNPLFFSRLGASIHLALQEFARARRARRFFELGRGIAPTPQGHEAASLRADRLYRKALRVVYAGAASPPRNLEVLAGTALRQAVQKELDSRSGLGWLARRHRLIRRGALVSVLVLLVLIATVPPFRRTIFPPDLAAGKPWVTSSAAWGFPAQGTMGDSEGSVGLFHTSEEMFPHLTIDLGTVQILHEVTVANRRDCCRDRALPLAIQVSRDGLAWQQVGYRRAEFRNWTASFPATPSRFVRLRVERKSVLHLGRVVVH
jgi:hypothetical protein